MKLVGRARGDNGYEERGSESRSRGAKEERGGEATAVRFHEAAVNRVEGEARGAGSTEETRRGRQDTS